MEAANRLGVQRPSSRLIKERLRWIGHVLRSDDAVLREVIEFIPEGGAHGRGRPTRRYDTIKVNLAACNIVVEARDQSNFWSALATKVADRVEWRKTAVSD